MKKLIIILVTLCTVFTQGFLEAGPIGWNIIGTAPEAYQLTVDSKEGKPAPSGLFQSIKTADAEKFAATVQSFYPKDYLGKRVRITGQVKTVDLMERATLWARVDTGKEFSASFDNMYDRPIIGDTEWTTYYIVIDVPHDAISLNYGSIIVGEGKVWMDEFKFEVVDKSVPLTGLKNSEALEYDAPFNTDFSQ